MVWVLTRRMGILSLVWPKRVARPERDWEDHQPQFVDQVVLHERAPELIAGRDDDFSV